MRNFHFEKLWLLSEKERRARKVILSPKANALVGTNHTGKSTISRNLFSAFGCKTRPLGDEWDKTAIVAVEFVVDEQRFIMLRRGTVHTLLDSDGEVLWATSDAGELRDKFSQLVDFVLTLTSSKTNEIRLARPAYFFVPFFIDQDGSWDSSWRTFSNLGEFQQWDTPTLDIALGIRPSEYWQTTSELAATERELGELIKEQSVLEGARLKLAEKFPRVPWYRDAITFRKELKELEDKAGKLAIEQDAVRSQFTEMRAQRDALRAQVQLIENALMAHAQDMQFLEAYEVGEDIVCPTCGTPHEHSFHERLNLEAEADELRQLRITLTARADVAERESARIADNLQELDTQAKEIEVLLDTQRGALKLRELVDRAGIDRAYSAFDEQRAQLDKASGEKSRLINELKQKLLALDDKKKAKAIRTFFNTCYSEFAQQLDVPPSLRTRKGKLTIKPQQGGSGGPRAVLAYYFAIAHTAAKFSPAVVPPLVIDSPHQKAQDEINRPIVTEFIFRNRVPGQQLIVGLEEALPQSVQLTNSDSEILLQKKYELLRGEEYEEVYKQIEPWINASREFFSSKQENTYS